MNKNMRTWVIGICVALVIIVAVALDLRKYQAKK